MLTLTEMAERIFDPRDYNDWAYIFGEADAGNTPPLEPEPVPPGTGTGAATFDRDDVEQLLHAWDNDDREFEGAAVLLLTDGRFAFVTGGCDYTGWD